MFRSQPPPASLIFLAAMCLRSHLATFNHLADFLDVEDSLLMPALPDFTTVECVDSFKTSSKLKIWIQRQVPIVSAKYNNSDDGDGDGHGGVGWHRYLLLSLLTGYSVTGAQGIPLEDPDGKHN